jgi:hypothetical protein
VKSMVTIPAGAWARAAFTPAFYGWPDHTNRFTIWAWEIGGSRQR